MTNYNDSSAMTFGGVTLNITSITPVKKPRTVKQKIGMNVVEIPIISSSQQDYMLQISGLVLGSTMTELGTNRNAIEALDDAVEHAFADGIHDGNYIIDTGSLRFNDSAETTGNTHFTYSMTLIQIQ